MVTLKELPFANVPMAAEPSFGKDWFHQDELGAFTSDDFGETYPEEIYNDYLFYRDFFH